MDRRAHKLLPCRGLMERTLLQRRETSPIRIAAIQDSAAITDTAPTRGSERPARKPGSSHTEFDIIYFWYEPKHKPQRGDLSRGLPRSKDTCAPPPASRRCMHTTTGSSTAVQRYPRTTVNFAPIFPPSRADSRRAAGADRAARPADAHVARGGRALGSGRPTWWADWRCHRGQLWRLRL